MNLFDLLFMLKTLSNNIRKDVQPSASYQNKDTDLKDSGTSGESAYLAPYYHAPKTDPELEAVKQALIEKMNYRDGAKNYYKNIPIVKEKMQSDTALAGAVADKRFEPYIIVNSDKTFDSKKMDKVLQHELLHLAPQIPDFLLPVDKKSEEKVKKQWDTKDIKTIKSEQFAEQKMPKLLYSYIFK